MGQCRGPMAQRHVRCCKVADWNGLSRRERGQGDLGGVRASAGADPGLATIRGWRLVRRAFVPFRGVLIIVAGHPGALGRDDLLRHGCLLDVHAGRSDRAANPVEHEGDTENQAQKGRRNRHQWTISHARELGVQDG